MAIDPAYGFASAAEMETALAAQPADVETIRIDTDDPGATQPFVAGTIDGGTRVLATPSASPRTGSRGARRWVAAGLGVLVAVAIGIGVAVTRDDGGQPDTPLPSTAPTVVGSEQPVNGGSLPATTPTATVPAPTSPTTPDSKGPKEPKGPKGKAKDDAKAKGPGKGD